MNGDRVGPVCGVVSGSPGPVEDDFAQRTSNGDRTSASRHFDKLLTEKI